MLHPLESITDFRSMQSKRHLIPEQVLLSPIRQKHERNEPAVLHPSFGVSSTRALMPASSSAVPEQRRVAAKTAKNDRMLRRMRAAIQQQSGRIAAVQQRHARRSADRACRVTARLPRAEFAASAAQDGHKRPSDRHWDVRRYGSQGTALWEGQDLRAWYSAGLPLSLASAGVLPGARAGVPGTSSVACSASGSHAAGAPRRLQQYAWAPCFTWAEHAGDVAAPEPLLSGYCTQAETKHVADPSAAPMRLGGGRAAGNTTRVPGAPLAASGASLLSPMHPHQLTQAATNEWKHTARTAARVPAAGSQREAAPQKQHWSHGSAPDA